MLIIYKNVSFVFVKQMLTQKYWRIILFFVNFYFKKNVVYFDFVLRN